MKLLSALLAAGAVMSVCAAEPLWKQNGIGDLDKRSRKLVDPQMDGSLKTKFATWLIGKELIPATGEKAYRITCEVKGEGNIRVGVVAFDKDKKGISIVSIMAVKGTETELTAPLAKGDTVIKVKDTSKWNLKLPTCIAYDADPSGEMKDLPNNDFIPARIKGVTATEIQLAGPARIDLPAGTIIRQHQDSRRAVFSPNQAVSGEWKTYQFIIGPGLTKDHTNSRKLYPGVAFVSPMVVMPKGAFMRNLQIEVVE